MKLGRLFFLNFGRISFVARIAIIPLIFFMMHAPIFSPLFPLSIALLVTDFVLSLIIVPSDRKAKEVVQDLESDFARSIRNKYHLAENGTLNIGKGCVLRGKFNFRRDFGTYDICPHMVFMTFIPDSERVHIECAVHDLIRGNAPDRYSYVFRKGSPQGVELIDDGASRYVVVRLSDEQSAPRDFYIKKDYHLRGNLALFGISLD